MISEKWFLNYLLATERFVFGFCWKDSSCSCLLATTTKLFSQSLSSRTLCSFLEIFSYTKINCKFWQSKFKQISIQAFSTWDDIFRQERNGGSPNNLCNFIQSPFRLSTNFTMDWKIYLSRSKHHVTFFRIEMNVGGFSEHQNNTSHRDRHKGYFYTARVSQVNVNTMKRIESLSSGLDCGLLILYFLQPSALKWKKSNAATGP